MPTTGQASPANNEDTGPATAPPVLVGVTGWSGPLPLPETLVAYDRAHAVLGGTIVKLMVDEAEDRRRLRRTVVEAEIGDVHADRRERRLGQHYALVIGIVAITGGVTAAGLGHDLTGSLIGGGGVVGLVAVFVQGRASGNRGRYPTLADVSPSAGGDRPR